jgi:hypothetical protein
MYNNLLPLHLLIVGGGGGGKGSSEWKLEMPLLETAVVCEKGLRSYRIWNMLIGN